MGTQARPLAIITGASTGIGFELAKIAAQKGFNLVVAADEQEIETAAATFRSINNTTVDAVQADLATLDGVEKLIQAIGGRPVAALIANAGRGLGHAFLEQGLEGHSACRRHQRHRHTLYLLQRVGRDMVQRHEGRILIVGSIAGLMPGTFHAVYNGTKAFLDSFSFDLRAELKDTGVTVKCLMPGATETDFFERADMLDTKVGQGKKQPADEVARTGWDAMMKGEGDVVAGWQNKLQAAISHITPSSVLAEMHRKKAEPGGATK